MSTASTNESLLFSPLIRFAPPQLPEELRRPKALNVMKPSIVNYPPSATFYNQFSSLTASKSTSAASNRTIPATEDILAAIMPPREVYLNGRQYFQLVSLQPATRLDVIQLQQTLDNRLVRRQAKEFGLCPIRYELYSETFDELIRQITIDCPERGLLLLRIRDAARKNIQLHRMLFESAMAFGVRRALIADRGLSEMKKQVNKLRKNKVKLKNQISQLNIELEKIEKEAQEERILGDSKRKEQIDYLCKSNQLLNICIRAETEKTAQRKLN